jgi:type I restriction enzyme S subunit
MNKEFTLPNGWKVITIGEIAESINPGFPSGRHNQEGKGVPHLRPMNISRNGEIDLSQVKYVETKEYHPLCSGDVLFNNTNSTELVGKTTYIAKDTNWAYSNHMTRIRLKRDIAFPAWVAMALHFNYLIGFFKLNCRHHVNQASINSSYLANKVSIPLPPLPEQERIVARIEELFTQLDAGTAALRRVQAGLKRYKASVLKAACEGRLFGEINARKGCLPEGWQSALLEDCVDILDSRRIPINSKERNKRIFGKEQSQLFPYFGATGQVGWIDNFLFDEELILLGEDGAPFLEEGKDKAYIVSGKYWVNNHAHVLRARNGIALNKFVIYSLNIFNYLEYVTGTTRLKLTQSQMRRMPILLPPLAEQYRIISEVEQKLSVVKEIEMAMESGHERGAHLRQSILRSAFEGRLT